MEVLKLILRLLILHKLLCMRKMFDIKGLTSVLYVDWGLMSRSNQRF